MNDYLLIGPDDLAQWTPYSPQINFDQVRHAVLFSQRNYIRPALCDALYEQVLEQAQSDTLTPENQALLGQVIPPLCYYAFAEAVNLIHYQVRTKGVVVQLDNTAATANGNEVAAIRKQYENWGEAYMRDVKAFLKANRADYPLWDEQCFCGSKSKSLPGNMMVSRIKSGKLIDF